MLLFLKIYLCEQKFLFGKTMKNKIRKKKFFTLFFVRTFEWGFRWEGVRCYRNLSTLFLYNRTDMYADELSGALLSLWLKQWPEKALSDADICCTGCSNVRSRYRDQIIKENHPLDSVFSAGIRSIYFIFVSKPVLSLCFSNYFVIVLSSLCKFLIQT